MNLLKLICTNLHFDVILFHLPQSRSEGLLMVLLAGRWECPWHQCDVCGKEAASFCEMCPSSYCCQHRDGLLFISKLDGKLSCSEHDPCGPEPLEPGEIREYNPAPRALTSGLGMAVIPAAASSSARSLRQTDRGAHEGGDGGGAGEPFPPFSIKVPITIPVAPPAASPPHTDTPSSPFHLPHYSPISSYEEERDVFEEDEEELLEDSHDEGEAVLEEEEEEEEGLDYLELEEEQEEDEDEEEWTNQSPRRKGWRCCGVDVQRFFSPKLIYLNRWIVKLLNKNIVIDKLT